MQLLSLYAQPWQNHDAHRSYHRSFIKALWSLAALCLRTDGFSTRIPTSQDPVAVSLGPQHSYSANVLHSRLERRVIVGNDKRPRVELRR
jgi:hypothetical protein